MLFALIVTLVLTQNDGKLTSRTEVIPYATHSACEKDLKLFADIMRPTLTKRQSLHVKCHRIAIPANT